MLHIYPVKKPKTNKKPEAQNTETFLQRSWGPNLHLNLVAAVQGVTSARTCPHCVSRSAFPDSSSFLFVSAGSLVWCLGQSSIHGTSQSSLRHPPPALHTAARHRYDHWTLPVPRICNALSASPDDLLWHVSVIHCGTWLEISNLVPWKSNNLSHHYLVRNPNTKCCFP